MDMQSKWVVQIIKTEKVRKPKVQKKYFDIKNKAESFIASYTGKGSVQLYKIETLTSQQTA